MKITDAIKKYRLPNPTTQEDLESNWNTVLNFGDKVLVAGYYYNGPGEPEYFAAIYEYLDDEDKHTCESTIGLTVASDVDFHDNGHAVSWAINFF